MRSSKLRITDEIVCLIWNQSYSYDQQFLHSTSINPTRSIIRLVILSISKRHCFCSAFRLQLQCQIPSNGWPSDIRLAHLPLTSSSNILVSTRQQSPEQRISNSSRKSLLYTLGINVRVSVLLESCLDPGGDRAAWERSFEAIRAPQHYQHLNPHRPSILHP